MPRKPSRLLVAVLSAATAAGISLAVPSLATPGDRADKPPTVPAPPAQPTKDDQFQNIDQVRTAIKAYYGDTETTDTDPVDGSKTLHTFDNKGAYAKQVKRQSREISGYVRDKVGRLPEGAKPAIVFDVDDTTLNTYNYEIYSNFAYNPTTNAAFVNSAAFPHVPGMLAVVKKAQAQGVTIFFLTGRPETQRAGTVQNLEEQGYPSVPSDQLILKDYNGADPWLESCAPSCTTVQYKSLSRAHIQSLGYQIIGNLGDQFSDLEGGHANKTFKIPNPMYYLP